MQENIDELEEEFLDQVFGYESKLDKDIWIKNVVKKCGWVFNPTKIRQKVFPEIDRKLMMCAYDDSEAIDEYKTIIEQRFQKSTRSNTTGTGCYSQDEACCLTCNIF